MHKEAVRGVDHAMLSAWHKKLKATRDPTIKHPCLPQEAERLARFAEVYGKLNALRRRVRRSWQRKGKRALAGIALLLALGPESALAATITVDGATCTLSDAITAANTDAPAGTCTRGLGPDTIALPPNRPQVLTRVDNTVYGPTGLPVIRSDIKIVGNGNIISRSAPIKFRIFAVARSGKLTLSGLTLRGGFAPRHPSGSGGGGVRSVGVLTSTDVVFDRNQTDYGSGGGLWA